jgi:hypothetical protein
MNLPAKRKRPRMRVQPTIRKVWPRHRRWVRLHGCCVPGCGSAIVDFAHLRSATNAGKDQKPHDAFGVSLCRAHHYEQHQIGVGAFDEKYGTDLWTLAAEFAHQSPDWQMRASLKLIRADEIDGGSAGSSHWNRQLRLPVPGRLG